MLLNIIEILHNQQGTFFKVPKYLIIIKSIINKINAKMLIEQNDYPGQKLKLDISSQLYLHEIQQPIEKKYKNIFFHLVENNRSDLLQDQGSFVDSLLSPNLFFFNHIYFLKMNKHYKDCLGQTYTYLSRHFNRGLYSFQIIYIVSLSLNRKQSNIYENNCEVRLEEIYYNFSFYIQMVTFNYNSSFQNIISTFFQFLQQPQKFSTKLIKGEQYQNF
ncbi:hypothetical protein pb186bvf_013885 [Paramecium bursaria]